MLRGIKENFGVLIVVIGIQSLIIEYTIVITEKIVDIMFKVSYDEYSDRVAGACGACNLGRNLRGSPHFTVRKGGCVSWKRFF